MSGTDMMRAMQETLVDHFASVMFRSEVVPNCSPTKGESTEITEPKTCLGCGAKQQPDGSLPCGH